MDISDNPILRRLRAKIEAFRLGQLDLGSLQYEFRGAEGALDGSVSRSIRDAVTRTQGEVDYASLHTSRAQQRASALEALDAFEAILESKYRGPSSTT